MRRLGRRGLAQMAGRFGYELRAHGRPPRGFPNLLALAAERGLAPRTVFDVGVGYGTPWLYDAFPAARLVLFEPLPVFDQAIGEICRSRGAERHPVALSNRCGTATITVPRSNPTGASLRPVHEAYRPSAAGRGGAATDATMEVRLARLDDLNSYEAPFLLKIDAEGAERDILEGAARTLAKVEFLLLEAAILPRHKGEASFAELVTMLDRAGFRVLDFPSMSQASQHGLLVYVDVAFVRKDDPRWDTR